MRQKEKHQWYVLNTHTHTHTHAHTQNIGEFQTYRESERALRKTNDFNFVNRKL